MGLVLTTAERSAWQQVGTHARDMSTMSGVSYSLLSGVSDALLSESSYKSRHARNVVNAHDSGL